MKNITTINHQDGQLIEIILKTGHKIVLTDDSLFRLRIFQHGFEDRSSFINDGIKEFSNDLSDLYDVILLCGDHDLYNKEELITLMNSIRYAKQYVNELAIPVKYRPDFEAIQK